MKNLKALRESKNISQQKLGESIGLSQQAIYKYENHIAEPDIQTMIALADYFETSVDYLIGYTDIPQKHEPRTAFELNSVEETHMGSYRRLPASVRLVIDAIISEYLKK